jgi:hypothetical protein
MKCGEICARRARISASIARVRDWSSWASSSWDETQRATSQTARVSATDAVPLYAASVPTGRPSTISGAITASRTGQSSLPQSIQSSSFTRPVATTFLAWISASSLCRSPPPSQARSRSASVMTTASVPRRRRRCRAALRADSGERPSRSTGAAKDTLCIASYAARSVGVP